MKKLLKGLIYQRTNLTSSPYSETGFNRTVVIEMDLKKLKNDILSKLMQFWEWIFTSDEDEHEHEYEDGHWLYSEGWYEGHAKATILVAILAIIIIAVIFFVIWLDNYIKYHF